MASARKRGGVAPKRAAGEVIAREFMTAEEIAAEDAELARKAQEELERIERERTFLEPLVFNETTRDEMPSISPRDQLSYKSDKKAEKETLRFFEKNPTAAKLAVLLQVEILKKKPENILAFILDEFFADEEKVRRLLANTWV